MVLVLLARNPTDSVTYGLLPAAERLGLTVRVLTDDPQAHRSAYAAMRCRPEVEGCAVTDVRSVLAAVGARRRPQALLSNSDHLQTQTALAADYFGLAGKDWRSAIRARDKGLMRAQLRQAGLDDTAYLRLRPDDPPELLDDVGYPAVLKPAEGVASEDVVLVRDRAELAARVAATRRRRDGDLLVEGLIEGPLHTLETLGDGNSLRVWGGYQTRIGAEPYFIEERLTWRSGPPGPALADPILDGVLAQLRALGVGFGPCHTEFIVTAAGPRIVEVNDRLIGDHCDFAMADLLAEPVFEDVIGVHLGRPPRAEPGVQAAFRHGLVHSVLAEAAGVLIAAPDRVSQISTGNVRLDYWPIRRVGDSIRVTGTNRDDLGTVRVVGPDAEAVESATAGFLADQRWVIG
jgi:biotin carboxylase